MDMTEQAKHEIGHIEVASNNGNDDYSDKYSLTSNSDDLAREAKIATDEEHELGAFQALKDYYPSVLWGMLMCGSIIMEGYDTILISSFFAYPSFQKKYGHEVSPGSYQLSGSDQSILGCASSIGIILSLLINGWMVEKYGHRKVVFVCLCFMTGTIFITVFAKNVGMLIAGQILNGFAWGPFSIIGLFFASEVAPLPLRSFLTAYVMMCWATGQLIAAGVLKALVNNTTEWSYRLPFALQWVWIPPLMIATVFCPDSPYWLVRKGRLEDAEKSLKRLSRKSIHHKLKQKLNLMVYTNQLEKDQEAHLEDKYKGWKAYLECFKGPNLRRTEISGISIAAQVLGGNNFAYSPSYFFSQVGLSSDVTYNLNLAITGLAWVGTFSSWFIAGKVGRRTIFLVGLFFMDLFLLLIGILQTPADSNPLVAWGQVACTFAWVVSFVLTLAPVAYTVTAEVSSTRLRSQTIAIGRNTYNICQLVAQIIQPKFINPTELNLKGRTGFIWFGTGFLTLIWVYFRLPETKDRTYEELDILFEKRIPAPKFSKYNIDHETRELYIKNK